MKVVGIGSAKGRCYEYLPVMTVPREEATSILLDLDFDTLHLGEDYAASEVENLVENTKNNFTKETSKYSFNIPSISSAEITKIALSLKDMQKAISERVSTIK